MSREPLPNRRATIRVKRSLGNFTAYLDRADYSDGRPAELWIDLAKAGTDARLMSHALASVVSLALQHGTPAELIAQTFESLPSPLLQACARHLRGDEEEA